MNRQEIRNNFLQMRKEEIINIQKAKENEKKEKIKIDITNRQKEFLSSINFYDIKSITIHTEEIIYLILYLDLDYDIYNNLVLYSIEYNNGLITEKKEITKKVFEILYTKQHYIEFFDNIKIMHFI